jgi:hypothetical protein
LCDGAWPFSWHGGESKKSTNPKIEDPWRESKKQPAMENTWNNEESNKAKKRWKEQRNQLPPQQENKKKQGRKEGIQA